MSSTATITSHHAQFRADYDGFLSQSLSLDMTRGKPSPAQLALSKPLLSLPGDNFTTQSGTDTRNYGIIDGLPEIKTLFSELLGCNKDQVIVGGNSSLTMMYDSLQRACQFGVPGGNGPWNNDKNRKFLCPTPGYDRHFLITEHLGFELISVAMTDQGPDMDQVRWLVKDDPGIKGIWCVPKYSNPTGCCYSEATVNALATMSTAADDFRIIWDNAYAEHHFTDHHPALANIGELCALAGHDNRAIQFASTSKMSLPGAGVAAMASSPENIADAKTHLNVQGIGPDKINQLRHLQLFGDLAGLRAHMREHAALIKPKFDRVDAILEETLGPWGIASWTRPQGGYFINLDIQDGQASKVIQLAADAGVRLTAAGAPFPYGKDPFDKNIRIAPTFPNIEEIDLATRVLATCVALVASE